MHWSGKSKVIKKEGLTHKRALLIVSLVLLGLVLGFVYLFINFMHVSSEEIVSDAFADIAHIGFGNNAQAVEVTVWVQDSSSQIKNINANYIIKSQMGMFQPQSNRSINGTLNFDINEKTLNLSGDIIVIADKSIFLKINNLKKLK